ncbi:MAG TPA: FHA domain-containing protein [Gemmataceae bacterium]|nr:FHA domain-containing protein [Gemmataceae bacterium]
MKVSLVVASGVHQGKVIPIIGSQFLIGRDPECHLRPASQAVSKKHCGVLIRDGKVYLQDFGSTNGTVLNDGIVKGEERVLSNNDSVKVGPLDFTVRIELLAAPPDGTPLPDLDPQAAAALAAVKAVAAKGTTVGSPTPTPKAPPAKPSPALSATPPPETTATPDPDAAEHDRMAAMLLGLGDDEVPGGSTVVDVPAVAATGEGAQAKPDDKKDPKKSTPSREETSNAASEILRKYMRRPK